MKTWIKNPLAILAKNSENGIVIDEALIVELVAKGRQPSNPIDNVIDAGEHVVIPGLINTHHHYSQTLNRAFSCSLNKELREWAKALHPVWSKLTPESLFVACKIAIAELLLSGCTTSADHHYIFPNGLENAIDIEVQAVKELGIRSVLVRGGADFLHQNGGFALDSITQNEDVILDDCERVINKYHNNDDGSMLQIALGPCSKFIATKSLMKKTAQLANKYNVRLHTHTAEGKTENTWCRKMFNQRPIDYLDEVGWLNSHVWLAHAIHFTDNELKRLGNAKVGISHCPSSNMILSSGMCKALTAERYGCNISIGVDGSASNDSSNMIRELRQAFLLQRLQFSSKVNHEDVFRWGSIGGAKVLGRDDIGEIALNKQADIAMFKLNEIQFMGAENPLAALIICGATHADRVMVKGKWLVIDGALQNIDLSRLEAEHKKNTIALQR